MPRRWLFWLLVLALGATWLTLFQLPLFDEDEGEYAEVAVEMAHSGDFITPTLNGQAFFEKPILAFWLQAPLVDLWGAHAWVFRLPSLLACLLWIIVLGRFARQHWGEEAGMLASLLCLTSLGVTVSAHAAAMDGVLCLLITLAQLDIYRSWKNADRSAERRVFLWMALGFLAKGPVAVAVPLLTSLLFYGIQRQWPRWFRAAFNPWGWAIFLVIAAPWYVAQYHLMGAQFVDYFLWRENVGRITGTLQGHGGGFFYYFPVLLVIAWPHTQLLFTALSTSFRQRTEPLTQFLLLWFLVVFVLFSLAHTKLPHYLLIGLPPLFLLMARHHFTLKGGWLLWLPLPLLILGAGALPFLATHFAQSSHNPYLHSMLAQGPKIFGPRYWIDLGLVLGGCLVLLLLSRSWWSPPQGKTNRSAVQALLGVMSTLFITLIFLPAASHLQQDPVLALAKKSAQYGFPIVADNRMPSFAVYSGHSTINHPPHPQEVVFIRADHLANLPPFDVLEQAGGLYLVRIR
ncbi:MAG: glycosyltransferase family 39 protein [Ferrovum sp.]|nr:glycosyltransferase family 39 protein [Ferrovum sp.]NDU87370.1 glycosyltransferase family 39 protein [Ferrovum sp.]